MTATLFADDAATDPATGRPAFNSLTQAERDKLVTDNIGLARVVAVQVADMDPHADADDLFGECCLAFVESARRWRPDDGTPFGGYAAGYARRRLSGRVIDAHAGGKVVRGRDMGVVAGRAGEASHPPVHPLDEYDRELLRTLRPAAREIIEAVVRDGCTPDQASVQFDRALKDVLLICRNAAGVLEAEKRRLDEPDLTDFADSEPAAAGVV